jgi:hypothetical protein
MFPEAYWELVELVLAGCPDDALKAYRRTLVIGKGKRLTAKQADNATSGATKAMGWKDTKQYLAMQDWYIRNGYPAISAARYDDEFNANRIALRQSIASFENVVYLEWDDNGVDRHER